MGKSLWNKIFKKLDKWFGRLVNLWHKSAFQFSVIYWVILYIDSVLIRLANYLGYVWIFKQRLVHLQNSEYKFNWNKRRIKEILWGGLKTSNPTDFHHICKNPHFRERDNTSTWYLMYVHSYNDSRDFGWLRLLHVNWAKLGGRRFNIVYSGSENNFRF